MGFSLSTTTTSGACRVGRPSKAHRGVSRRQTGRRMRTWQITASGPAWDPNALLAYIRLKRNGIG